ncbi:MAG: DUF4091 domain-containing protein [Clostridia bacterium]|nr:DUF4091 domain-containing protein [Clostridia bacterium]
MKKLLKNLFLCVVTAALLTALLIGVFSSSAASDDPADSYQKQTAPYEDPSIDLWFEHSFKKVFTSDTTSSGMDTYSVYMAKNEIENAQFVLYSDTTHTGLTAEVSQFTNENGDKIKTELLYEMYVTTENLNTTSVLGSTEENTIIREGETPDPLAPFWCIEAFQLNGGKSQAFLIKLRTTADTPSGWYSAQVDIKDAKGNIIKTATVFAYVWDFELSEETAFQSAFIIQNNKNFGGSYKQFYDYLLENRLVGMDVPGGTIKSTNPYLTNPRVNAIRVSHDGNGSADYPSYMDNEFHYSSYTAIYNDLKNSDVWDTVKDKLYFYTVDEPMSREQQDAIIQSTGGAANSGHTITEVIQRDKLLDAYWGGEYPQTVIPYHQNHPYPYYYYQKPLSSYAQADLMDSTQAMIDTDSCRVWCPHLDAFTPREELLKVDYNNTYATSKIRTLTGVISGMYSTGTAGNYLYYPGYYDWDGMYGEFPDRVFSDIAVKKAKTGSDSYKMWAYLAGASNSYTYCHHLIENTGLQTKMLFWQFYQNDITGYLYYATNEWAGGDKTVTGNWTESSWPTRVHTYADGYNIYGMGVLFYAPAHGTLFVTNGVVGTIRVEIMRDGVEEYQMLKMLEEYKGNEVSKGIVGKVSNNVVDYLSLPGYSTAGWDSDMDEYDIMASVRKSLGHQVEAAVLEGQCDHNYDDGKVIKEATCLKMGTLRRTCTLCGAENDEIIPTLHAVGDTFEKVSGTAATCLTNGSEIMKCTVCGFEKKVETTAFHLDPEHYLYEYKSDKVHHIKCAVCNENIDTGNHVYLEEITATCTEDGEKLNVCKYCDYTVSQGTVSAKGHNLTESKVDATCTEDGYQGLACTRCDYTEATVIPATGHGDSVITEKAPTCTEAGYERESCETCGEILSETVKEALGHKFSGGTCTVCGEADPDWVEPEYTLGDINGDGAINGKDSNQLKQILSGGTVPTEIEQKAADVNGDGTVNGVDANVFAQFLAGAIGGF